MAVIPDTDILMDQIRNTIKGWSDGSLSASKVRQSYQKLQEQYLKLERKYISDNSRGYVKGLLHHHNMANSATLTALFLLQGDTLATVSFAGDAILLNALPGLIMPAVEDLKKEPVLQKRLGEQGGQSFTLTTTLIEVGRETLIVAAVASTPLFSTGDFTILSKLIGTLYAKSRELKTPVMLNYINDISAEISRLFSGGKNGPVYTDNFILFIPPGAFTGAGVYNLIDFSRFIVQTLKLTYPSTVHIFALSLSNYFVLFDEKTRLGLDVKRNRIDFDYHGNNIPYKVNHTEIGTQQQLYLFLESL